MIWGSSIGVIKEDTRSLDYSSSEVQDMDVLLDRTSH